MTYKILTIEQVCDHVTSGGTPSRSRTDYYKDGTIQWFKSSDLKGWYLVDAGEKITDDALRNSSAKLLPADTILLAMYGDGKTIGSTGMLRGSASCNQACCAMIINKNIAYSLFVLYAIQYRRRELVSLALGGAQRNLSAKIIKNFQIPIPGLESQRRIASILSAYDDLIENNTRRIKILEEMARSLYSEWFVYFRVPGHQTTHLVSSALGKIPHAWRVVSLKAITDKIGSGSTPLGGKSSYKKFGAKFIRSLNVYDYDLREHELACIDEEQAAQIRNVSMIEYDIIVNITGYPCVGRCCMIVPHLLPAYVSQHVSIIRSNKGVVAPHYLLDYLNNEQNKRRLLARTQGGTARQALTKSTIETFEVMLPTKLVMEQYEEISAALENQRVTLKRQSAVLRQTRDLLLPKLMSGEIDVSSLPDPGA